VRLETLRVRDFRNLANVELETGSARFVVLHGPNAQGKTNLLEAVFCLATLKSFRTTRTRELIRWGQPAARIEGRVHDGTVRRRFELTLKPTGRTSRVDGKPPTQLAAYFEGIRAVLFAPEDIAVVRGGPEVRRRFVDRAAFTASASFLEVARTHKRLLDQKGKLLRQDRPDPVQLDVFDEQLALAGARLVERRVALIQELQAPFAELHGRIAGASKATLGYRSCLGQGSREELTQAYRELLEGARATELRRRMNLVGPQRDDLKLGVDGRPARAYASQGQARSVVLALKLAELLAARERGARPVFLLDDLSSELDQLRTGRLVRLLDELDLQVVVTTTDPALVLRTLGEQAQPFAVAGGSATPG
jgi:DNA replication and repair protein RecF